MVPAGLPIQCKVFLTKHRGVQEHNRDIRHSTGDRMTIDQRLRQHVLGYWEVAEKPSVADLQTYYANKYYQDGKGRYDLAYGADELAYFRAKLDQRGHVLQTYLPPSQRSAARRGGNECVRTGSSGWSTSPYKKQSQEIT